MPKKWGPLDALVPGFPLIFSCSALVLPNVLMWMEEILQHCTYPLPQEVLQHFAAVKLYKISSIHGRTQSAVHFPCIMTSTSRSIQPTRKPNCQTPPKPKALPQNRNSTQSHDLNRKRAVSQPILQVIYLCSFFIRKPQKRRNVDNPHNPKPKIPKPKP